MANCTRNNWCPLYLIPLYSTIVRLLDEAFALFLLEHYINSPSPKKRTNTSDKLIQQKRENERRMKNSDETEKEADENDNGNNKNDDINNDDK